jgi:hypothetical protein
MSAGENSSGGIMMGAMLVVWTLGFISGYRIGADMIRKRRSEEFDPDDEYAGDLSGEHSFGEAIRS